MTNTKSTHINCPECNTSINIKEAIAKNYQNELSKEERTKIRNEEKKKIESQYKETLEAKDLEIEEQSTKIVEFNTLKADIKKLEREKKQIKSEVTLEYEEKINEELDKKDVELNESKIQVSQLQNDLEKMRKRVSQGSVQLQGEAQEIFIEDWLKDEFIQDNIIEIKKGVRGADVIHEIIKNGEILGRICVESKRTEKFQNSWIEKIKEDSKEKNCQISVIVSDVLPKDLNKNKQIDGIWICTVSQFKLLSHALRLNICEVSNVLSTQKNRTEKTNLLFNYITSKEFGQDVDTIVQSFVALEEDLEKEKRAIQSLWKKRSKLHGNIVKGTTNIYGSLKGIAGNAIKQIDQLELPHEDQKILKITNQQNKKGAK